MPSINISVTPELLKLVQDKVASGMYNNASEVVREAIRQMEVSSQMAYEIKLQKLRETLAPALRQADAGEYAEYSLKSLQAELDHESK